MISCPLCQAPASLSFLQDDRRAYLQCTICRLIFVPPQYFLSTAEEKAHYDQHQNSPTDLRYRQFLSRLFNPVQARIQPKSCGLDFGAGPGPTLSVMFEEAGHQMRLYDPFYAADASAFQAQYDFITASEVLEHLHQPKIELERLWRCLKPGGTLGLMTKLARDRDAFATWHYKNDPTHVIFFSRPTFLWLGKQWGVEPEFVGDDVIIYSKVNKT